MSVKGRKPHKKRGRPSLALGQLNADKVVYQAKVLLQKEGKIPSIRKLAGALNVDAMAIYYYFKNKNALLEAVTVSLIDGIYEPSGSPDWRKELCALCLSYLQLLHDHPGLLETLLGLSSAGPAGVFIERFERALLPLTLPVEHKTAALELLADYLHGYALALNCQQGTDLSIEQIDGPLNFYMDALVFKKTP